jgi:hypothetical protein
MFAAFFPQKPEDSLIFAPEGTKSRKTADLVTRQGVACHILKFAFRNPILFVHQQ